MKDFSISGGMNPTSPLIRNIGLICFDCSSGILLDGQKQPIRPLVQTHGDSDILYISYESVLIGQAYDVSDALEEKGVAGAAFWLLMQLHQMGYMGFTSICVK